MEQATTIGLDIAKYVSQVHGWDAAGHLLFRKRISRVKVLGFLAAQARWVVAMEACAGVHYWAREIAKLGHHVRLIAPVYVKAFIKRQKNDAADAEAICEATQPPSMRSGQDRRASGERHRIPRPRSPGASAHPVPQRSSRAADGIRLCLSEGHYPC
jgi:transposase